MRALVVALTVLLVAGAAVGATLVNRWDWTGADSRGYSAQIGFQREGSGPLFLTAGAFITCPGGTLQTFGVALFDKVGVPVHRDGTFAYTGPTDGPASPTHPMLQLSGRLAGTEITGTFRLSGEVFSTDQPPCHAESELITFTAQCEQGYCPKPIRKHATPATVFPGVGIGGAGLGMRGIARLGMTAAQIRALHRGRPSFSQNGKLVFQYGSGTRAQYYFSGPDRRLRIIELLGRIRTARGIVERSTEAQLVRAYPGARCKVAGGFRVCSLLRGTKAAGVLTLFELNAGRLFGVALYDCVHHSNVCAKLVAS